MIKRAVFFAMVYFAGVGSAMAAVGQDVAGMAIAGSNDHVYIWYRDGTVSSGNSRRLDRYRTPYAYSTAAGQSPNAIVATAIAKSNDRSYVWYSNGKASAGSTSDLDSSRRPYSYALPPGKTPADIIGITISGADHVFAWYKDGTYTEGTSNNLDAYTGPISYKLAPGYQPKDVLGMATASNNRVYVWYNNGYMSAGAPNDLDAFIKKRPYAQSLLIKSEWGPGLRFDISVIDVSSAVTQAPALRTQAGRTVRPSARDSAGSTVAIGRRKEVAEAKPNTRVIRRVAPEDIDVTAAEETENEASGRSGLSTDPVDKSLVAVDAKISTGFKPKFIPSVFDTSINSIDPMLAAGKNYIVASQYQEVEFLSKLGTPLPEKNGVGPVVHANDLFAAFLWDSSNASPTDVNRLTGFPRDCYDPSYPQTSQSGRMCIVEAYDVRAFNDPLSDRWIIIANLRNKLNTDIWSDNPNRYADEYKNATGKTKDRCGFYTPAGGSKTFTDDVDICAMARRQVAVAVSKTSDPRDGFHLYAISTNNYRDFPWATINGDVLLINNHGAEMIDGAVATGISISDLEAGRFRPSYFQYFREDVDNHNRVLVPQHGGNTDGLTIMYGTNGGKTHLYAFPQPTQRFAKPPLTKTVANVRAVWPAYYRGDFFHMVGHHEIEGYPEANMRRNIIYTRLPVNRSFSGGKWTISTSRNASQGYRRRSFGKNSPDDPTKEIWSYEEPVIAVTPSDDVVIAYGRMPVYTIDTRYPDVRYTVWYHNESSQRPSLPLIAGQAQPKLQNDGSRKRPNFVHHAGAVVDPANPQRVWISHVYLKKQGTARYYQQFIGRVQP